jgi:hypothetical protein
MTLATTADAARYLASPPADLTLIQPFLDAATAWVERITGRDWDATGTVIENFYNVRQGTVIRLRDEAPTVTQVLVFPDVGNDDNFFELSGVGGAGGYRLLNRGRLQLVANRFTIPFEGAHGERMLTWWSRVKVTYTASAVVPTPIREAVAMIAASDFSKASSGNIVASAGGITSEKIGDYSYTLSDPSSSSASGGSGGGIPPEALRMLRPYSAARRVRNT